MNKYINPNIRTMKLDNEIVRRLVFDKIQIRTTNVGARKVCTCKNGKECFSLFEADCNSGEDFYFVATDKYDLDSEGNKIYSLYKDRAQIWKVPENVLDNWKTASFGHAGKGSFTRHLFSLDTHAVLLWDEEQGIVPIVPESGEEIYNDKGLDGDQLSFGHLTMRDYACTMLMVPESSKQWLNDLIKLKNKNL